MAEQAYNEQVKKAALHRKNMLHLLETQVELLKTMPVITKNSRRLNDDYLSEAW